MAPAMHAATRTEDKLTGASVQRDAMPPQATDARRPRWNSDHAVTQVRTTLDVCNKQLLS